MNDVLSKKSINNSNISGGPYRLQPIYLDH